MVETANDAYSEFLEAGCGVFGENKLQRTWRQLDIIVRGLPEFELRLAARRLAMIHEKFRERLNGKTLAKSLGVSRATLYRRRGRKWIRKVIDAAEKMVPRDALGEAGQSGQSGQSDERRTVADVVYTTKGHIRLPSGAQLSDARRRRMAKRAKHLGAKAKSQMGK
ncbi:MAG TPA: hypothetical protein PLU30_15130 [Verrucomicrobiae bacterium]|nr:hypothetical protein [Verrucomicrobiae bacterium]